MKISEIRLCRDFRKPKRTIIFYYCLLLTFEDGTWATVDVRNQKALFKEIRKYGKLARGVKKRIDIRIKELLRGLNRPSDYVDVMAEICPYCGMLTDLKWGHDVSLCSGYDVLKNEVQK